MLRPAMVILPRSRLLAAAGLGAALCAVPHLAWAQGYGGTVADYLVRGESLLAQKRGSEAMIQFQEARTLCPTPAEIVSALQGEARAHLVEGEFLPAAGILEEAASRFPDDPRVPDILYLAGLVRQQAGEVDGAIDLLRRSLARSPTPDIVPGLKFQLARALRMRGKPAEAVETLQDFETTFPNHPLLPNVLYTLAIAEHDLGRLEPSEAAYRGIIERFPGTSAAFEAHFELASVLADDGKRREAVDLYRKYVGLNPSSPVAAKALERAGDLLLFRAPKESAELYALAAVKARVNPPAPAADLSPGRFLGAKRRLAEALSRAWVVALAGLALLGIVAGLGVWLKRRRGAPAPAGA